MTTSGYILGNVPTPPTLPSQRLGGRSGVSVPAHIYQAVSEASAKVGVSFAYLMTKASTESSFNPNAQASTSSASGLYQFIERTWLDMVDKHGAAYGLEKYANAITRRADGTPVVADRALRKEILDLRKDPEVSALMAAEYAGENKEFLEKRLNRDVTDTDLYLAHFLGAGGAARFLKAMAANPSSRAASVLPEAASANRGVFYASGSGRALSLQAVYERFENKFEQAPTYYAEGTVPGTQTGPGTQPRVMDASYQADDSTMTAALSPAVQTLTSDETGLGAIPSMYLMSALSTSLENDETDETDTARRVSGMHAAGLYLAAPGAVPSIGSIYQGTA